MKRRHYGTAWNSKRGRINPDPMPNLGVSRRHEERTRAAVQQALRLLPAITVILTANVERFLTSLRAASAAMRDFQRRQTALETTAREFQALAESPGLTHAQLVALERFPE